MFGWYTEGKLNTYNFGQRTLEVLPELPERIWRTAASGADMEGSMIALWIPINIANQIKVEDGEPPEGMHITLAYFIDKAKDRDDWDIVKEIVEEYSKRISPELQGEITGYGTFDNDGTVLWAKPEIPGLEKIRDDLVRYCETAGFEVDKKFDFNPHITLKYYPAGEEVEVPELEQPIPVSFDELVFAQGMDLTRFKTAGLG